LKVQLAEQFALASEPQLPVNGAGWPLCAVFTLAVVWTDPFAKPGAVLPNEVEMSAALTRDDAARKAVTTKTHVFILPPNCAGLYSGLPVLRRLFARMSSMGSG
jgi:hypothetical protein